MKKTTASLLLSALFAIAIGLTLNANTTEKPGVQVHEHGIVEMLENASAEGHNSIIVLTDSKTANLEAALELAVGTAALASVPHVGILNRDLDENSAIMEEMELNRFPSPYVLIVSPSGMIAGGVVPGRVQPERLAGFVPSPKYNQSLNARKDGKPAFIVVYQDQNQEFTEWLQVIEKSSEILDPKPEIIMVSNSDESEASFLNRIGYHQASSSPQLFVVNPVGQTTGRFASLPAPADINAAAKRINTGGCSSSCSSAKSCDSRTKQECK
jgi:hypothetical protein